VNQLQRAGLALDAGRILIAYGGNDGDCATYWGWLVSAPTDGSTTLSSFQVDAGHSEGAIWASGNAPAIDGAGNVFVATGNGAGNATTNPDYGDSVVKLSASASPLDFWAPPNWQALDASDADVGSSMPTLLPGGWLFQSGKDDNGYLLNAAALGHVGTAARELTGFCAGGSFGGSVYDPGNSTLYVTCGRLTAVSVGAGSPPLLAVKAGFSAPSGPSGPPTIAGGLVWVANSSGNLYGLDPNSGAARSRFSIPENGSQVNHFATPSAGGGRLFVASGNQVTAVTIAQTPGPTTPPVPLPAPLPPPRVSNASLSPRRFPARSRTVLRLTLNEPATITVALTEVRHGHRVGRRCSAHARRGKRCLARVTVRRLTLRATGGRNAFKLLLRRLAPGQYTALVYATDASRRRSRTVRIAFTILRARR
jgi:hypothetical protein